MTNVLISSTSGDLSPYRDEVKEAVLELGWQPVMMEYFGADAGRGILEVCLDKVRAADVVVGLVAWRLGSVPSAEKGGDGERSYTQFELDAAEQEKKLLLFLASGDWPGKHWARGAEADAVEAWRDSLDRVGQLFAPEEPRAEPPRLPHFRSLVRRELTRWWQDRKPEAETPVGEELELQEVEPPAWPDRPYPLLGPYEHPELLGGRDADLAELETHLERTSLILGYYAASGAGKSSVLRAGLRARLQAAGRPVAYTANPDEATLGHDLLSDLVRAGGDGGAAEATVDAAQRFAETLVAIGEQAGSRPVLVLDQFEDLFQPGQEKARARAGLLLAATTVVAPRLGDVPCRWLLSYREEYHGRVSDWLRDVLAEAETLEIPDLDRLPRDLSDRDRFHCLALRPVGTSTDPERTRAAFLDAITTPLEVTDGGRPRYGYAIEPEAARRLAEAFAKERQKHPEAPLVPQLQVVLQRLIEASEKRAAGRAEEKRGGPVELRVPEDLTSLIASALEDHTRAVLRQWFAADSRQGRTRRTCALIALRELATVAEGGSGRRGRRIDKDELEKIIGAGGAGALALLAGERARLIYEQSGPRGPQYELTHDQLAEVVVRLTDGRDEEFRVDFDPELLRLRRLVHDYSRQFESGDAGAATKLSVREHGRIAEQSATLIGSDESRVLWWAACERYHKRQDARRRSWFAAVAVILLMIGALGSLGGRWLFREQRLKDIRVADLPKARLALSKVGLLSVEEGRLHLSDERLTELLGDVGLEQIPIPERDRTVLGVAAAVREVVADRSLSIVKSTLTTLDGLSEDLRPAAAAAQRQIVLARAGSEQRESGDLAVLLDWLEEAPRPERDRLVLDIAAAIQDVAADMSIADATSLLGALSRVSEASRPDAAPAQRQIVLARAGSERRESGDLAALLDGSANRLVDADRSQTLVDVVASWQPVWSSCPPFWEPEQDSEPPSEEVAPDCLPDLATAFWVLDWVQEQGGSAETAKRARTVEKQILESFFTRGLPRRPDDLFELPACGFTEPWVTVPKGRFEMGSKDSPYEDERPVHTEIVTRNFQIQRNEVAVSQLEILFPSRGSPDGGCKPGANVSWYEAYVFAAWSGARLPTEAEWEYVARGTPGRSHRRYPWDNANPPDCDHAQLERCEGRAIDVCSLVPGNTPEGVCDMAGNIWEWVADPFARYPEDPVTDRWVLEVTASRRVLRGGGFYDLAGDARSASRSGSVPWNRHDLIGFRVVRPAVPTFED